MKQSNGTYKCNVLIEMKQPSSYSSVFPQANCNSTPSTQDDQSSDEDSIGNELAATAGISHLSLTLAPSRQLSHAPSNRSSKGKQREVRRFGGDDWDNNLDSHAYDDYGYNRLVSTNFTVCTLTKDKKLQLLISLSSLESRVELFCNNKCSANLSNCVRCKTLKNQDIIKIMADSSASNCFMHSKSNLTEFEVVNNNDLVVKTASKAVSLKITGKGVWMITHKVTQRGKKQSVTSCLYPLYYLPGLTHRLMSVGHLLNNGLKLEGSSSSLEFSRGTSSTKQLLLQFKPYCPGQNIYWLTARLTSWHAMLAMSLVTTVDYDIMHRHFAHPSKDVLRHASGNTQNFPSNILFPSNDSVCQGCAEGKMTRSSFPPSPGHSKAPFDKIHMDLKEFSVQSYSKYKFFILFFDNCTSFGWIVLLRHKSEADPVIRQFIAMVKNQFNKVIHEFMIDVGGKFKSKDLRMFLKELGINILTSVPHMHQQSGRAERFIQTIVEKAQAIHLEACLSQNWWEFAVNYAVHIYNRTPLKHASNDYKMLFERLHHTKPDVTHLRVFGCGAYVFLPEDVQSNNLSPRSELMTLYWYC
jgi:hypothetical protein